MYLRALRTLTLLSFRRAMSGSRPWAITAVVVVGLRALRRLARDEPEVLYRTRLQPGDRILVSARGPR